MVDASAIREHMEVIGANGAHVGTVDKSMLGGHCEVTCPPEGGTVVRARLPLGTTGKKGTT